MKQEQNSRHKHNTELLVKLGDFEKNRKTLACTKCDYETNSVFGVNFVERDYVPPNSYMLVNRGVTVKAAKDELVAEYKTKEPEAVVYTNLKELIDEKAHN